MELAAEREKWAAEQVEIERRLFADALAKMQGSHLAVQVRSPALLHLRPPSLTFLSDPL